MAETILRPKRARLDEAHAIVYGCSRAALAETRARLPDASEYTRPIFAARVYEPVVLAPDKPLAESAVAVDLRFERVDFRDGARRWAEWRVVPEIRDPRAAWEALATRGVIPGDWVECPRRVFLFDTGAPEPETRKHRGPYGTAVQVVSRGVVFLAHPPTVAACVAFAADVPGVLAAEELAREFGGPRECERVVWRVRDRITNTDPAGQLATHAMLALRALGYAAESYTDDTVTLVCPELS